MTRRVVSITPFYNETHILELRLGILENIVDRFYTIEADKTFTGLDKPMLANTIKHPKHTVVEIEFPEGLGEWGKENYQRDVILDLSEYNDDDIVLITDLDEIPNPKMVEFLRDNFDPEYTYSFNMVVHQYYLNNQNIGEGAWWKAKACSVGEYRRPGFNATSLRLDTSSIDIPNGGWHWTFCGDTKFIKNKIEAFAHTECNTDQVKSNLDLNFENNTDTLGRGYELRLVDIDSDFYPEYLRSNKEKYSQYIKEF
jgi:beta-1,4-mannosyl-glycoprotein beta-1,4-N-acetylglucosaminyltransferase